jgi:hypothetical protein
MLKKLAKMMLLLCNTIEQVGFIFDDHSRRLGRAARYRAGQIDRPSIPSLTSLP